MIPYSTSSVGEGEGGGGLVICFKSSFSIMHFKCWNYANLNHVLFIFIVTLQLSCSALMTEREVNIIESKRPVLGLLSNIKDQSHIITWAISFSSW